MTIGYDSYILNRQIALDLTFEEMIGTMAHCRSPFTHNCTLHGVPVWTALANGLPYLDFDSTTPDWLDCPGADTTELDYQAGDFSMAAWIYLDSLAAGRTVLCRGLINTDGWHFGIQAATGEIALITSQGGADQTSLSAPGAIEIADWFLIGVTRVEASVRLYNQGVDVTDTVGVHIDPDTSARELHIGIYNDEATGPMEGRMYRPRIWSREVEAWEWARLFNLERDWFGV